MTARTESVAIDWEGALWECISHLQALIRMDTVNPPGREMGVARYMDDVLRGAGIETTLLFLAPMVDLDLHYLTRLAPSRRSTADANRERGRS